jgi:hypothetical protein
MSPTCVKALANPMVPALLVVGTLQEEDATASISIVAIKANFAGN